MTDVMLVHRLQAAGAYQERAELDRVAAWWREDRGGVCALVGLGGAGKTALAERFLRLLGDPALPPLPPADGVFVYSFYEQPIAEVFFSALHRWLGGEGQSGAHFDALSALKAEKKKLLTQQSAPQ